MTAERSPTVVHLRFGDLPQPVRFTNCGDLIEGLRSILRGWDVRQVDARAHAAPVIRVTRTRRGYRRVSCWLHRPSLSRAKVRRTLVEAICGFHFEFIDWYLAEHPDTLFVHGAAALFSDRLVVFPALAKAGKSTLTVHLALSGRRVFCDDVLPIDTTTGRGVALGIVPRLRPPLPPSLGEEFHRFVEARRGHGYRNRLYVNLDERELAPLGTTAPVGGIVLLHREPTGPAVLTRLDPADALERIILQNFAREVPAPRILHTLADVVGASRCVSLRYARTADAVAALDREFGAPAERSRRGGAEG